MSKEITISSLKEYVGVITNLVGRLRKPDLITEEILFFRGYEDKTYELIPSIARKPEQNAHNDLTWFEERFVHEARRKLPDIFVEEDYPMNLLTKLQHFGIPTRLLDITTNALVALFFACTQKRGVEDREGEVIVFKQNIDSVYSYTSPIANAIAQSYLIAKYSNITLDHLIKKSERLPYFYEFSFDNPENDFYDREDYLKNIEIRFRKPIFIFPLELSERQKRQQGAFIIFPNKIDNTYLNYEISEHIEPIDKEKDRGVAKRIIIPADKKELITRDLKSFGITEDFLFPDSIDVICQTITGNIKGLYK